MKNFLLGSKGLTCGGRFAFTPQRCSLVFESVPSIGRGTGKADMFDEKNNSVNLTAEPGSELPAPAHFDEVAIANAQPVRPLSRNRVSQRISDVIQGGTRSAHASRKMFAGRGAALVLVVICGLAAGAVAGTLLVTERRQPADTRAATERSVVNATQDATEQIAQNADASSILAEVAPVPTVKKSKLRVRALRNGSPVQRSRKAYRVAVIR
jgi:hypothetical protein